MADNKVKFLRGTATKYEASTKDSNVFYYTTDTKKLYLGANEVTGVGKASTGENAEIFNDYKKNDASGIYSHAEGHWTTASGDGSHAEGTGTTASGTSAHAGGHGAAAGKSCTFAHGEGVEANSNDYEVAFGVFNKSNTDTLFSIGNGTDEIKKSNAFEITKTTGKLFDKEIATKEELETHTADTDIHVTTADKEKWNGLSNPNLLDNPDFAINQGDVSGEISTAGYFVDRWKLKSGTVTLNSDGSITLDGAIEQMLEKAVGTNTTASASAGTASYNDSTKTFTLTASGKNIAWAKLEIGSAATPYSPPDYASELAKCQRYFQRIKNVTGKYAFFASGYAYSATKGFATFPLAVPLRSPEACTSVLSGTLYAVNAAHIGSSAVQLTEVSGVEMINGGAAASINIVASGLAANTPIMLQFRDSASYLDISSEL